MSASRMFPVTDFFEIKKGKRLTKANMVPGDIPFVGSSATNNGITAYIGNDTHLHEPGTITVSYNGSVGEVFLQDERFWASDDVNVWYPKQKMTIEVKLYFMAAIKKLSAKYSYTNKWTIDKMRSELVELPVDSDGKPNFNCMQERISELEQERISELEQERISELDAYLAASGLDDYELTDEDKEILSLSPESASDEANASEADCEDGQVRFKKFALGTLFTSSTGDVDLQQKDINGKGEFFINSGVENRGIKGRTDRPARIFPANTITVDFWGNAYYRDFEYKMATHNHVFSLAGDVIRNRHVGMYIAGILSKLPKLFSYNNMATWNKLKTIEISLPVTSDGNINFNYMERYIRAIEKLAIADVAKYKDKLIAATKQVVGM